MQINAKGALIYVVWLKVLDSQGTPKLNFWDSEQDFGVRVYTLCVCVWGGGAGPLNSDYFTTLVRYTVTAYSLYDEVLIPARTALHYLLDRRATHFDVIQRHNTIRMQDEFGGQFAGVANL